jgi:hypothetical protein
MIWTLPGSASGGSRVMGDHSPRDALDADTDNREAAAGVVPSERYRCCVLRAHGLSSETLLPSTGMGEQAGQSTPHARCL